MSKTKKKHLEGALQEINGAIARTWGSIDARARTVQDILFEGRKRFQKSGVVYIQQERLQENAAHIADASVELHGLAAIRDDLKGRISNYTKDTDEDAPAPTE